MKAALAACSALISALAVILAIALVCSPRSGGFLPDLGPSLAIMVLGLANLPALILNGIYWHRFGAPIWLRAVVILQLVPVMVCLYFVAPSVYDKLQELQGEAQRSSINEAIRTDDADRFAKAQSSCQWACGDLDSLDKLLLQAASAGSLRVATRLVGMHVRVSTGVAHFGANLYTCDRLQLPSIDALSIAAARNNAAMVRLLFPVSDSGSRRRALWTAAQTDRLEMVQLLSALGMSLDIRGDIMDENKTLLVAAAGGAAMRTGRWLLDIQHLTANTATKRDPYGGMSPLQALDEFASRAGVIPRVSEFLTLLLQHGADVDAPATADRTLLAWAALQNRNDMARILLSAGAKRESLDASERVALDRLLSQKIELRELPEHSEGCVDTNVF